MTVLAMAGLTLRELDGQRPNFRQILAMHEPTMIIVADQGGRCVEVDLFPDGVDAWLVKITSARRVLFDCGGMGVGGLDDESLSKIIVEAFRVLDTPPPEPN